MKLKKKKDKIKFPHLFIIADPLALQQVIECYQSLKLICKYIMNTGMKLYI